MTTRCSKFRYRDKLGAQIALANTTMKRTGSYQESRAYKCPACKGWHLTSMSLEDYRNV